MIVIRPYRAGDYQAIAHITTLTRPEQPVTADDLRFADGHRDPKLRFGQWVAEVNNRVVGFAHHTQYIDLYDPHKFWVMVRVHPEHQRQGVGAALWERLFDEVQKLQPEALQVSIREDRAVSIHFAQQRGFTEQGRRWESILNVEKADTSPYAALAQRLNEQGITIKSAAELRDTPDFAVKFLELQTLLDQDVPIDEPITAMTLEQFKAQVLDNPRFLPEGTFIAVHDARLIGMSSFFKINDDEINIDLTGTLPDFRRKGIGTALKLRGIIYAQQHGYSSITTTNDITNTGMLAVNEQLGYVRQFALIKFVRTLV